MDLDRLLLDLAILFAAAVTAVVVLGRLGLPPLAGMLAAGVVVGPGGLGLVSDPHQVEVLAELGVALLLFTIGLEFSLDRLARIGRQVALGGGLQVALTVLAAIAAAVGLGAGWRGGVFWGYLAALSSTAIVLRALADREETSAPHGRFVVAVLLFQDLCVVPMMLTLPMLSGHGGSLLDVARTLGQAVVVIALVLTLARRVVPAGLRRVAATRRRELFVMSVLLVAISVALITGLLGLSIALGAFLAGVVIAESEFVHQAFSDIAPFRDAFASLFFVSIGMLVEPATLIERPVATFGLCVALMCGKFALATMAGLALGFPARVALLAGLALAQVGEFSFVLLDSGQQHALIGEDGTQLFLAASVMTMFATPLLLAVSPRIGSAGERLLRPIEKWFAFPVTAELERDAILRDHVVVAGLGVAGQLLTAALDSVGVPYVAIELNPETVIREQRAGRRVRYGDIASPEVLEHVAHAGTARALVLLLSDSAATARAASVARAAYPDLHIFARAHRSARETGLLNLGIEVVSEDYETALEIVERVLFAAGVAGDVMRAAVAAVRSARTEGGARRLSAEAVLGAVSIDALEVGNDHFVVDKTIAESGLRAATGALIVAVARGQEVITAPVQDFVIRANDVVFVFGSRQQRALAQGVLLHGSPS